MHPKGLTCCTKPTVPFPGYSSCVQLSFLPIFQMYKLYLVLSIVIFYKPGPGRGDCHVSEPLITGFVPKDSGQTTTFNPQKSVDNWNDCVSACCQLSSCDLVWMTDDLCYSVECNSVDACTPVKSLQFTDSMFATVERTRDAVNEKKCSSNHHNACPNKEYCYTMKSSSTGTCQCRTGYIREDTNGKCVESSDEVHPSTVPQDDVNLDLSSEAPMAEEVGNATDSFNGSTTPPDITNYNLTIVITSPPLNINDTKGMILPNATSTIVPHDQLQSLEKKGFNPTTSTITSHAVANTPKLTTLHPTTTATPMKALAVSAGENKVLQLPDETSVSIYAYIVPSDPPDGFEYHYEWSLMQSPVQHGGQIGGIHTNSITLTGLTAGLYMFQVQVTAGRSAGAALVNVTVLPPPRINEKPHSVIEPLFEEVTLPMLPNADTVLDGSGSTDDDKIVSYKWEQVQGPLSDTDISGTEPILHLSGLQMGVYIIKLTVTDSDGLQDFSFANITVKQEMDYPPQANAGSDVVIKLPQTVITLNGNASTDDKKIVSYEWSKESGAVVDIVGTGKEQLHLTNLEEGNYVFRLTVTDSAGHENYDTVMVIVQPENNIAPTANAGRDKELSLPDDTTVLDGSTSTDDLKIVQYLWQQTSGPKDIELTDADLAVATVSMLKEGVYVFSLTVTDGQGAKDTDTVSVTVKQEVNQPPVANAGLDVVVRLPASLVKLDGSQSSDDIAIESYEWKRSSESPAAGTPIDSSDKKAVLLLVDLVPGRYTFTLKVSDGKGLSSSDSVNIVVKRYVYEQSLVEITFAVDIIEVTKEDEELLLRKLSLFMGVDDHDIVLQHITSIQPGRFVMIYYVVDAKTRISLKGQDVVDQLKKRLQKESDLLDYPVISLQTLICQNTCSGHGTCNIATRYCNCESFWIENPIKARYGFQESNCDWSILYVIIVAFFLVVGISVLIWTCVCCISKRHMRKRRRHRYSLLDEFEEQESQEMLPKANGKQNSSIMVSESDDSEQEMIFEAQKKSKNSNGFVPHTKKKGRIPSKYIERIRSDKL